MRKLLAANTRRLWNTRSFWVTVGLMGLLEGLLSLLWIGDGTIRVDIVLFLSLQGIGVLMAIFLGSFFGTEYGDGTLRNKLIVGHSRSAIYLASFLTGVSAISVVYLVWLILGAILGVISQILWPADFGQLMLIGLAGWFACLSYIAIFNLIGMLSSSKSRTAIFSILTAFGLIAAGMLCYSLAQPSVLAGISGSFFQFLFEFNPFGQTFQVMSSEGSSLWRLIAYAAILSSICTGVGLYIFQKKELK